MRAIDVADVGAVHSIRLKNFDEIGIEGPILLLYY